jgi:hypothetical protein
MNSQTDQDHTSTDDALISAARHAMSSLAEIWGLDDGERAQFAVLTGAGPAGMDGSQMSVVAQLLAIYAHLHQLHPASGLADTWVKSPNTNEMFRGATPLEAMLAGGASAVDGVYRLVAARAAGN